MSNAAAYPEDAESLRRLLAERDRQLAEAQAALASRDDQILTLKLQIARLRRMQFGASSEKIRRHIDQLELQLEELEADEGLQSPAATQAGSPERESRKGVRIPLPDHLPRETIEHAPDTAEGACPDCGGQLRRLSEDVAEMLEYVPARFKVIRHVRPKLTCRSCEKIVQAPAPSRPLERVRAGPKLLAHVLTSKYTDHCPLYRQSEIYAREGVELPRQTLAGWVGHAAALIEPLVERIGAHVLSGPVIFADDTVMPVLEPGKGRTREGRLWTYVRDERTWNGEAPPAAYYRYAPDRKREHSCTHLAGFTGAMHADAWPGYRPLYEREKQPVSEVACWAHVRRPFHDLFEKNGSKIAGDALRRIALIYEQEKRIRGRPPDERAAHRQAHTRPVLNELRPWFEEVLPKLPGSSKPAEAIRYALSRWEALTRFVEDGRLEADNNTAERSMRPPVLGRKNFLFAGSDTGGTRMAAIYTLTQSAKLGGLDPKAYLAHVLEHLGDHPINRIDDFLPWRVSLA